MGMVNSIIKMEVCTMVIGSKIKWKAMANFTIKVVSLLIKACGRMINLWAKVCCLIKYLRICREMGSIIAILMMLRNIGQNTKV